MTPKKASRGTGETARTTVSKNHFHEMLRLIPQARELLLFTQVNIKEI